MKAAALLLALFFFQGEERRESPPLAPGNRASLRELRIRGNSLFQSYRYQDAIQLYERGHRQSLRDGDIRSVARFLMNIGSCRFAMLQYRPAMHAFIQARRLALRCGDMEAVAVASCNLSSLYLQLGDVDAGLRVAGDGLGALRRAGASKFLPELLAQSAQLHARNGDFGNALLDFRQALMDADGVSGKLPLRALIWDLLGYEFLDRGETAAAEHALLEAYRIRTLSRDAGIRHSYYGLGLLELARGNAKAAQIHLSRALVAARRTPGTLPLWRIQSQAGRALAQLGRPAEAHSSFKAALDSVRRWRLELVPADSLMTSAGVEAHDVYSAFIESAGRMWLRSGDPALRRAVFEASEEDRASGLRARLAAPGDWQERMPAEYWETLARLRAAEISLLGRSTSAGAEEAARLHDRLTELEAAAGFGFSSGAGPIPASSRQDMVGRAQGALRDDEAFLGFRLSERGSWLWAVTRGSFEMRRLGPHSWIASQVERFRREIRRGSPASATVGERLYRELFAGLSREVISKPKWLLAPDAELFDLPFAALTVAEPGRGSAYLVERHSTELIPGVFALTGRAPAAWQGPFVAIADPVYNTADPRWRGRTASSSDGGFFRIMPRLGARPILSAGEMPRLAGSGREAHLCAEAWSGDSRSATLLVGTRASRDKVEQALLSRPSILHFATHFAAAPHLPRAGARPAFGPVPAGSPGGVDRRSQAMIALSLLPGGEADLLTPTEILRWSRQVDLVVLNGCASGGAQILPGSGLMGMARAWLASGAGAVAATFWPTSDDNGGVFVSFYSHLRRFTREGAPGPAAAALRSAQIDALHAGGWRSAPGYWAAYFLYGKE